MEFLTDDGNIRPNEECPFISECKLRTPNCPSKELDNIRQNPFSCGAARFFVMVKEIENSKNDA